MIRFPQGPFAFVAPEADIGEGTVIGHNTYIGPDVYVGTNCRIGPNCVIGYHGFGYEANEDGGWDFKGELPDVGVRIEDDVHIGALTAIDRGSYRDTIIGAGTRIDNLVHVAHNVIIGRNCLVIAHAMLAGSSEYGDNAYIAPCASVREHLTVGEEAIVGMAAVVVKNVDPGQTVIGNPARVMGAVSPASVPWRTS